MSLILRQVIGYQQGRKSVPLGAADPLLKQELTQVKKDLQLILNKWKFGDQPIKTSQEFLNNFEPWITTQLEKQKEWKVFLSKYGSTNLNQLGDYIANLGTGETETANPELAQFLADWGADNLAQVKATWTNTEQDYQEQIRQLRETQTTGELSEEDQEKLVQHASLEAKIADLKNQLETYQKGEDWESQTGKIITDLEQEVKELREQLAETTPEDWETERDELTRDKKTLEQENLALHNRLNLKNEEVNKKSAQIELLKREKSQSEIALNKTITELRAEQKKLQVKYSKQGRLLDEEQTENNKLTEKIEELERKIAELKK